MPKTIIKSQKGQIIAGTFSEREDAYKAVAAFQDLDFSATDIQVLARLENSQVRERNQKLLKLSGFSDPNASFYDDLVNQGKILVAVYGVMDPAPVIAIFNKYEAEYNLTGSRNLREGLHGKAVSTATIAAKPELAFSDSSRTKKSGNS